MTFHEIMCWVCMGKGLVKGPLHLTLCPNPHCPHGEELRGLRMKEAEEIREKFISSLNLPLRAAKDIIAEADALIARYPKKE